MITDTKQPIWQGTVPEGKTVIGIDFAKKEVTGVAHFLIDEPVSREITVRVGVSPDRALSGAQCPRCNQPATGVYLKRPGCYRCGWVQIDTIEVPTQGRLPKSW